MEPASDPGSASCLDLGRSVPKNALVVSYAVIPGCRLLGSWSQGQALRRDIGSHPGAPESAARFRSYASHLRSRNVSAIDRCLSGRAEIGCRGNFSIGSPLLAPPHLSP